MSCPDCERYRAALERVREQSDTQRHGANAVITSLRAKIEEMTKTLEWLSKWPEPFHSMSACEMREFARAALGSAPMKEELKRCPHSEVMVCRACQIRPTAEP